jgi:hypothetical protein
VFLFLLAFPICALRRLHIRPLAATLLAATAAAAAAGAGDDATLTALLALYRSTNGATSLLAGTA